MRPAETPARTTAAAWAMFSAELRGCDCAPVLEFDPADELHVTVRHDGWCAVMGGLKPAAVEVVDAVRSSGGRWHVVAPDAVDLVARCGQLFGEHTATGPRARARLKLNDLRLCSHCRSGVSS